MCSTAAGSAIAVSAPRETDPIVSALTSDIAVDRRFKLSRCRIFSSKHEVCALVDLEAHTDPTLPLLCSDNKMNAGIAIFTLLASQLIGYGMAGMLTDLCVKPSQSIFPSRVSTCL